MLRITLLEDFGKRINLRFGSEVRIPMSFGAIAPELTTEFSADRNLGRLQAEDRIWPLAWIEDEEAGRSVLVPNEVGTHYFGNPLAGTDVMKVRNKELPSFNDERERVARTWGDYFYSDRKADGEIVKYATIRIHVPIMPRVEIRVVNQAGNPVGENRFEPWPHWRFEEMLDAEAEILWSDLLRRKGRMAAQQQAAKPGLLDFSKMTPDQLRELKAMLEAVDQGATAP